MRPLRLLLSLSTSIVALTLVLYITLASQQDDQREQLRHTSSTRESGGFKALFSFTSPGSLFPPSAIISLTDDNSTFFLARPAAFGPSLPKDGLSSPLWIGSGFGDDSLGKGELGCGDSLDWVRHDNGFEQAPSVTPMNDPQGDPGVENGDASTKAPGMHATGATSNSADKHSNSRATTSSYSKKTTGHADIQSLQESAEIEGKVVLLKRGTCGFQQKVLWAQERGAVAVIVGDNVRGGGLIRMYAQGDTSNVTIPSLFTSHTTAHLLSSLSPGGAVNSRVPGKTANTDGKKSVVSGTDPLSSSSLLPGHPFPPVASIETSDKGNNWLGSLLSALHSHDQGPSTSKAGIQGSSSGDSFAAKTSDVAHDVLPGSGEYLGPAPAYGEQKAWWDKWLQSDKKRVSNPEINGSVGRDVTSFTDANLDKVETSSDRSAPHEGLWVTLTPTNVSTSPFFDTLLVLVVSPLVTLTVVYALLLLRSRIRRRRWRAPKSLVERLPVRTYQTISDSTSSPTTSASSPRTPLLNHSPSQPPSPIQSRRPSSDEAPGTSAATTYTAVRTREEEKRDSGLAEWRRRYGGRQKECVVCLDEYEDGVSQVMSLPCGHEFHAACM
jgi:hypothetical protein